MKCVDGNSYISDQIMRGESENQMCLSSSLHCSVFSSLLPSSILFSFTALILSSTILFFKLTKRLPIAFDQENNLTKDNDDEEVLRSITHENFEICEDIFQEPELEIEDLKPNEVGMGLDDYKLPKLSDYLSESKSGDISFSSEDSDHDWSYVNGGSQFPMFSDDSIADDDSLIEIELLGGHFIGSKEEQGIDQNEVKGKHHYNIGSKEDPKFNSQKNLDELFQEQVFGQDLIDLLRDLNEMNEENLIEIDLSMGSIKCSRFEITT